jgi:hypothetical protein
MLGIVALPLDWLVVSYKAGIIPLAVTDVSGWLGDESKVDAYTIRPISSL